MIWCVEDDASIRDIEIYALRAAGFEVQGFPDGDSFWDALQQQHPDLVVLDVMLPGADGTELLHRMRATPSLGAIPVILATARGAEYDRISGLDSGADDYLVKPFSVMELASRVRAVLRRCKPPAEKRLTCGGKAVRGWVRNSRSSSYSLFVSVSGLPRTDAECASVSKVRSPTVRTALGFSSGFRRLYCARFAFTRATSTLGENGFSI